MATGGQTAPRPAAGPATVLPAGMRESTSRQVSAKTHLGSGYSSKLCRTAYICKCYDRHIFVWIEAGCNIYATLFACTKAINWAYITINSYISLHCILLIIPLMIHTGHPTDSSIGCTAYIRYSWGVAKLCNGGYCIYSQTWKQLTNEMWCCV